MQTRRRAMRIRYESEVVKGDHKSEFPMKLEIKDRNFPVLVIVQTKNELFTTMVNKKRGIHCQTFKEDDPLYWNTCLVKKSKDAEKEGTQKKSTEESKTEKNNDLRIYNAEVDVQVFKLSDELLDTDITKLMEKLNDFEKIGQWQTRIRNQKYDIKLQSNDSSKRSGDIVELKMSGESIKNRTENLQLVFSYNQKELRKIMIY
uniref:Uncharacterized protein n=1 Tax=Clytia hemisphaerica TaxID=252671 RepID=A0A7M5U1L4_9CNID